MIAQGKRVSAPPWVRVGPRVNSLAPSGGERVPDRAGEGDDSGRGPGSEEAGDYFPVQPPPLSSN